MQINGLLIPFILVELPPVFPAAEKIKTKAAAGSGRRR